MIKSIKMCTYFLFCLIHMLCFWEKNPKRYILWVYILPTLTRLHPSTGVTRGLKDLSHAVGKNSNFKIYKTPSARYIVVYLGCRPQGVVF